MPILARDVSKSVGHPPVAILNGISLDIKDGEFVALTGRSGSGKSTLLYLLGSLDSPSGGKIEIDGQDLSLLSSRDLCRFRNEKMGFIFQFHYLIAELSAMENVLLPSRKTGQEVERKDYAAWLLEKVGLSGKFDRLPRQLSGGEQQRVAVARALLMQPKFLFADEPTGALDSINAQTVMKILMDINEEKKTTIVMVTHDPGFAAEAKRSLHIADGRLIRE